MQGTTVILIDKLEVGKDPLNHPLYEEHEIAVQNVLVGQASAEDIVMANNLVGKASYMVLGIPKGDTHEWEDKKVKFFGHTWKTYGFTIEGIEGNIPTPWHKKIMVERYVG